MTHETFRRCLAADSELEPALSCTTEAFTAPGGRIVVLRVVGEIDMASLPTLRGWLDGALSGAATHLLVDLNEITFCSVDGFCELATVDNRAAEIGVGYALIGPPTWFELYWSMLSLGQIQRYRSVAQAVISIRTDQAVGDLG